MVTHLWLCESANVRTIVIYISGLEYPDARIFIFNQQGNVSTPISYKPSVEIVFGAGQYRDRRNMSGSTKKKQARTNH